MTNRVVGAGQEPVLLDAVALAKALLPALRLIRDAGHAEQRMRLRFDFAPHGEDDGFYLMDLELTPRAATSVAGHKKSEGSEG